ncbi:MAG: hypothetical protein QXL57_07375 [Candidatus Bathyarchaeia archaeon]
MIQKIWRARVKDSTHPLNGEIIIENIDKNFLEEQVSIAIKEYDKRGYPHKGPIENMLGVAAELAFNQFLKEAKLKPGKDYQWNQRKPNYWEEDKDRRPWDFKLDNGLTFEIGSARPFHTYAVFPIHTKHKRESDYFVQVQIKRFNCIAKVYHKGKERWYIFDARSDVPQEITNPEQVKNADIGECKI